MSGSHDLKHATVSFQVFGSFDFPPASAAMSLFYPSDKYHQSRHLIYSSIANFVIDLANIVNDYLSVELRVGTKLDCKDEYGMWCIAQVIEIPAKKDGQVRIHIHYCGWRNIYNEWIEIQSSLWRFDLLNEHTPIDEDLIIDDPIAERRPPFYRASPSISQRKSLVRRISEMGFPPDAVAREYEQFEWNRSPFKIFRDLSCEFPKLFVCRCEPKIQCAFCRSGRLR